MPGLLSCHIRAVRRGGDGSCPWLRASVSALCAMGVTRAHAPGAERPAPSLLPAPSRPGRRTPSLPECTGGETEAHREAGPGLRSHPGTEVVLVPASRAPQTPPHFPEAAELGEEEPGGRAAGLVEGGGGGDTHRKRHCSWSCDSKKHRMPSSPPDNCGRCGGSRRSLAHAWEGQGSQVRAEGPAPHPGPVMTWPLLTTPPEPLQWLEVSCTPHRLCSRCPVALSEHFLLSV